MAGSAVKLSGMTGVVSPGCDVCHVVAKDSGDMNICEFCHQRLCISCYELWLKLSCMGSEHNCIKGGRCTLCVMLHSIKGLPSIRRQSSSSKTNQKKEIQTSNSQESAINFTSKPDSQLESAVSNSDSINDSSSSDSLGESVLNHPSESQTDNRDSNTTLSESLQESSIHEYKEYESTKSSNESHTNTIFRSDSESTKIVTPGYDLVQESTSSTPPDSTEESHMVKTVADDSIEDVAIGNSDLADSTQELFGGKDTSANQSQELTFKDMTLCDSSRELSAIEKITGDATQDSGISDTSATGSSPELFGNDPEVYQAAGESSQRDNTVGEPDLESNDSITDYQQMKSQERTKTYTSEDDFPGPNKDCASLGTGEGTSNNETENKETFDRKYMIDTNCYVDSGEEISQIPIQELHKTSEFEDNELDHDPGDSVDLPLSQNLMDCKTDTKIPVNSESFVQPLSKSEKNPKDSVRDNRLAVSRKESGMTKQSELNANDTIMSKLSKLFENPRQHTSSSETTNGFKDVSKSESLSPAVRHMGRFDTADSLFGGVQSDDEDDVLGVEYNNLYRPQLTVMIRLGRNTTAFIPLHMQGEEGNQEAYDDKTGRPSPLPIQYFEGSDYNKEKDNDQPKKSSGDQNTKAEKSEDTSQARSDEVLVDSSSNKTNRKVRRQTSRFICTGCGRRDCEGNFMKLLRQMIVTAKESGFEIQNVIPDGNCMFAAIVDQLEINKNTSFSPKALRHATVDFLRKHPQSDDGTPYELFLDNENWEDYLGRMSQEGEWGDHIMLQAIAQVIEQHIHVIHNDGERDWTVIESKTSREDNSYQIYLGHVGEFHYVSLRPLTNAQQGDTDDKELYSILPSQNIPEFDDESKQEMFFEDYIEPFSDVPSLHMSFVMKKLIPMNTTLESCERMMDRAQDLVDPNNSNMSAYQKILQSSTYSWELVGDIVEGFYAPYLSERERTEFDEGSEWVDVTILYWMNSMAAFPRNYTDAEPRDLFVETDLTHAGFARLSANYPNIWGTSGNFQGTGMKYYIPSTHEYFNKNATKEEKDQRSNETNQNIISLFSDFVIAVASPLWPLEATEWKTRTRKANWPSPALIESAMAEGCHYVCRPHPKSSNPGIEFQHFFGVAEKKLANSLTREQRYGFVVFQAVCSHVFAQQDLITSVHLKSIFFRTCEQIPSDIWSAKPGACFFYLMDSLATCIERQNIPDYFITANNLIDHYSEQQMQDLSSQMFVLRSQTFTHLTTIAHKNYVYCASDILKAVRDDIVNFKEHQNARLSMLGTLVPASIRTAGAYIRSRQYKSALEHLQEAYEERLSVSTCEDALPFTAFLTQVTEGLTTRQQWWFYLFVDEKLYTSLCAEFSMHMSPVSLDELVGKEVADKYTGTLIPASMAHNLCRLCSDFATHLYTTYHTSKCTPFLNFAVEKYRAKRIQMSLQQVGFGQGQTQADKQTTQPEDDDFNDRNVFKIFYQLYVAYNRLNQLWILKEYIVDAEEVCCRLKDKYSFYKLAQMFQAVGDAAKQQQALDYYNNMPQNAEYEDEEY